MEDPRRQLAQEIAAGRRELEALRENLSLGPHEELDEFARAAIIGLQRDLRGLFVQAWGHANGETAWTGSLREPIRIEDLPGLIRGEMVTALQRQEITPRFEQCDRGLGRLRDTVFPDGTCLLLTLGEGAGADFPRAMLAMALVPAQRYLVLLVGMAVSRRVEGEEWPKVCRVRTKIGPFLAERWDRRQAGAFLRECGLLFHGAVAEELAARRGDGAFPKK